MQLASHYLFEPCACTPSSGWEKGRVERQVGTNRKSIFTPCLRFANLKDLNEHLKEQVLLGTRNARHPEISDKSVYEVYEEEKPYLRSQKIDFAGYDTEERRASPDCLVLWALPVHNLNNHGVWLCSVRGLEMLIIS